jgi:hypothetical protein
VTNKREGHWCAHCDEICYAPGIPLPTKVLPQGELEVLEVIQRTVSTGVGDEPVGGLFEPIQGFEADRTGHHRAIGRPCVRDVGAEAVSHHDDARIPAIMQRMQ